MPCLAVPCPSQKAWQRSLAAHQIKCKLYATSMYDGPARMAVFRIVGAGCGDSARLLARDVKNQE